MPKTRHVLPETRRVLVVSDYLCQKIQGARGARSAGSFFSYAIICVYPPVNLPILPPSPFRSALWDALLAQKGRGHGVWTATFNHTKLLFNDYYMGARSTGSASCFLCMIISVAWGHQCFIAMRLGQKAVGLVTHRPVVKATITGRDSAHG